MSYSPGWTNQDSNGHVAAGGWIAAADVNELEAAMNRRHRLMVNPAGDWPLDFDVAAGQAAMAAAIQAARDGADSLLPAGGFFSHASGWWQLSTYAWWLCPQGGTDEDKFIVPDARPPGPGEVGFFAKLNGATGWTDAPASGGPIRAVHVNELRDAAALLRRGRFVLRVGDGGDAKASRALPGGLWYPPAVARDGTDAMHSWFGGRDWLWTSDGGAGWLGTRDAGVTVRSSMIRLKPAGADVKLKLYHCKRAVNAANFSWTQYDAAAGLNWASAGGTGAADATHLADLELTADTWTEHSDATLAAVLQQMADGDAEPSFMIAPDEQTGWGSNPTHVQIEVVLDFELDGPPA